MVSHRNGVQSVQCTGLFLTDEEMQTVLTDDVDLPGGFEMKSAFEVVCWRKQDELWIKSVTTVSLFALSYGLLIRYAALAVDDFVRQVFWCIHSSSYGFPLYSIRSRANMKACLQRLLLFTLQPKIGKRVSKKQYRFGYILLPNWQGASS